VCFFVKGLARVLGRDLGCIQSGGHCWAGSAITLWGLSNLESGFWHKCMCSSRLTVENIARYVLCNFFQKSVDVGPKPVGSPPPIGSRLFHVSL
jgi:hypothetical protein